MSCLFTQIKAEQNMTDPYQIMKKHFDAIGGLNRVKAIRSVYTEGTVTIEGSGLQGSFKLWTEKPLKTRHEVDLTVAKIIQGDNGKFSWNVDANGKVMIRKDEQTLKEREVRKLMEEYLHLDPQSPVFSVAFEGTEKIGNEKCYVVSIKNSINDNVERNYYSTQSHYLLKTVTIRPDQEQHTLYSDYRAVDAVVYPFQVTVTTLPVGEKQIFEYARYELDLDTDSVLFEPPQKDVEDYEFTEGENAEGVPFQYIEDHVYVPVVIAGKERLWILDSGASVSVIDSSFAKELGLELKGPIKARATSGTVDCYYVNIPSFSMKGIRFNKQTVMSVSIRKLFSKILGLDVVGILGYDFLSRFVTKIDYANEQLSFYLPATFRYNGDGCVIDSPLDDSRMFSLPATVDGKYSGKWRLDVGATGLDFHYPFADDHGLTDLKGVEGISFGAAGELRSRTSRFNSIELNGLVVERPLIDIPVATSAGTFSESSLIGNIGNMFLRHFVLYLDYENQRVILEKGGYYDHKFPGAKAGMQTWYTDANDIEVFFVAPDTPADEAGLKKGDVIKSINGIDVKHFNGILAIRELFREREGTTYTIDIVRGTKNRRVKLTLRELY
jgi:hypothetical protein